ncbi:hypothetical protein PUV47_16435 [Pseudovibrio exalbescens]|uniref:hypothetical protein n=1 Tax=Pseudovibrio exalbescens TaxID=197461 RepID=UPI002365D66A|nr:hypothetical protein [Pseudovibrio exalbescens]MDD7911520.1 hypothetical protein [Pseudovibrio exalbescens]
MSLRLIYPPQTDPTAPDVELIDLAARVCAMGGHLLDANQLAFRRFLSGSHAAARCALLEEKLADSAPDEGLLNGDHAYGYYRLLRSKLLQSDLSEEDAGHMLSALLQQDASPRRQDVLRQDIERRLEVGIAPYYGQLRLNDLTAVHSTEVSSDLRAVCEDQSFPYHDFWRVLIRRVGVQASETWLVWLDADQQLLPAMSLLEALSEFSTHGEDLPNLVFCGPVSPSLNKAKKCGALPDVPVEILPDKPSVMAKLADADIGVSPHHWVSAIGSFTLQRPAVPVLRVTASPESNHAFHSMLASGALDETSVRLLFVAPSTPDALLDLAGLLAGKEAKWSATLGFGRTLSREVAQRLAHGGLSSLMFEVKGFAGWPDEPSAQEGLLASWRAAKQAGLYVSLTLVYGFPRDTAASFERFISFLEMNRDEIDQILRLKLYRVPIGSPAHQTPEDFGIVELMDPGNADLPRTLHFRSETGLNSENFFQTAAELAPRLKLRDNDLPPSPLHADEGTPNAIQIPEQTKSGLTGEFGDNMKVTKAPGVRLVQTQFDYRALDDLYGDFRPRPNTPPPQPTNVAAKKAWLAYNANNGRILNLSDVLGGLLNKAEEPVSLKDLTGSFPPAAREKIELALKKLMEHGLLVPERQTADISA